MTWRLAVFPSWGTRGDPGWLPKNGGEGWRRVFDTEDMAGEFLRDRGTELQWRDAAEAVSVLASVLGEYRVQLRIAEDEAARCHRSAAHLDALVAAGRGGEPPQRSHPAGAWRVRAWEGEAAITVGRHASVDQAEGDASARRTGDASIVCWAEPDVGPAEPVSLARGWWPRVDREVRYVAFAVEEAVASLCAGAAGGDTGPDVLDVGLLCLLGQAAWRSIHEYRTLLAAAWTDFECCPEADDHETGAAAAMGACTSVGESGPAGPWRHLVLLPVRSGLVPVELSVHKSQARADASVAAARATDEEAIHWAEPVVIGPRPSLSDAYR